MRAAGKLNKLNLICFIFVVAAIIFDAYLQFYLSASGCSLVYIQRLLMFVLGVVFLAGYFYHHSSISKKVIASIATLVSSLGLVISLRLLWIQHFAVAENVNLMMSSYSAKIVFSWQWLRAAFAGIGSCAVSPWNLMGISLATFCSLFFAILIVASLLMFRLPHSTD